MARKKPQLTEEIEFEMSSGNVFADLGIENSEEELTKAKLAWEIEQTIKKKLTKAKLAWEIEQTIKKKLTQSEEDPPEEKESQDA